MCQYITMATSLDCWFVDCEYSTTTQVPAEIEVSLHELLLYSHRKSHGFDDKNEVNNLELAINQRM